MQLLFFWKSYMHPFYNSLCCWLLSLELPAFIISWFCSKQTIKSRNKSNGKLSRCLLDFAFWLDHWGSASNHFGSWWQTTNQQLVYQACSWPVNRLLQWVTPTWWLVFKFLPDIFSPPHQCSPHWCTRPKEPTENMEWLFDFYEK